MKRSTLQRDFEIFTDTGFLVAVGLILAGSAVGAAILISAAEQYGIPLSAYFR